MANSGSCRGVPLAIGASRSLGRKVPLAHDRSGMLPESTWHTILWLFVGCLVCGEHDVGCTVEKRKPNFSQAKQ